MPALHRIALPGFYVLLAVAAHAGGPPKLDSAWGRYYNAESHYCVSYPSRWYKSEAFDGSGLYVMAGAKKHARATGEIDVALFRNATDAGLNETEIALKSTYQAHLAVLQKFVRAERLEVLEQRATEVDGLPALFTKERYYDPQDRSHWLEEIVFVRHNADVYRLELECKADQIERFEPVFSRLLKSFDLACGAGHLTN